MRKILILIPRMGGGGAERVASIIANKLSHEYIVQITTLVSEKSFYCLDTKVKLTSANYVINHKNNVTRLASMGKNFINAIFYTRNVIKEYRPDIVFSLLEEMDIVTYLATRNLKGFKWICSERNDPTKRNPALQKVLEKIYCGCDILVCQTKTVEKYYSMVKNKKVIPNPVDIQSFPQRVEESKPPKIVAVGRLVPQKNIGMLVESFSMIAHQYPNVHVTVYGEGPERKKLENLIRDKNLQGRFGLPGSTQDIIEHIKDAAIFALPSNYEGFPNVLLEAAAMGVPIVSTDFETGAAKEIINENVGILVPLGDARAFATALSTLLANEKLRKHIRCVSRAAVEPFEVDKVATMWEVLFKTILGER